jgi:CPA2 family monovalent cation:H+ antiporter-2
MHVEEIIKDLGVLAVAGAVCSVVCRLLGIPLMIAYLITGILVGPAILDWVNPENVHRMAELGVVFLMFHLGMEFDLKRLKKLLVPSVMAVGLQTAGMLFLGFQIAPLLGWSGLNGFYLGSMLAISSSMVSVRVLRNAGELKLPRGQLVVGILILEDILAVLLLVILSGVRLQEDLSWAGLWSAIGMVAVFVAVFFVLGRVLVPRLGSWIARVGDSDQLALVGAALAVGIGLLAGSLGLSLALGAFLAGTMLAQTRLREELDDRMLSVRQLTGAVFFMSVGMLVNPVGILQMWEAVLAIGVAVVLVKIFTVWAGLFLSGESGDRSFVAASSKAQIGEFSFIISALGLELGVTDSDFMNMAIGVALVTIIATPILHSRAEETYKWMLRFVPKQVRGFAKVYHEFLEAMGGRLKRAKVLEASRPYFQKTCFYFLLLNGIYVIGYLLLEKIMGEEKLEEAGIPPVILWTIAGAVSMPVLIAAIFNANRLMNVIAGHVLGSKAHESFGRGRLSILFEALTTCLFLSLAGGVFFSFAAPYLPKGTGLAGYCMILVVSGALFWGRILRVNLQLEKLFLAELGKQMEQEDEEQRQEIFRQIRQQSPWPVQVFPFDAKKGQLAVGKRIRDLDLRKLTGASILALARSGVVSYEPSPDITIFPGDRLYLFGTTGQNEHARRVLESPSTDKLTTPGAPNQDYRMETIYVGRDSMLVNSTLAGLNLRKKHGVNVLAIQRGDKRIAPPSVVELIREGDALYVFGRAEEIREIQNVKRLAPPA